MSGDANLSPSAAKANEGLMKGLGRRFSAMVTGLFSESEPAPQIPKEIGAPYNFKHVQHATPDPHSSTGFSVRDVV